jgi:hypothetical protein
VQVKIQHINGAIISIAENDAKNLLIIEPQNWREVKDGKERQRRKRTKETETT